MRANWVVILGAIVVIGAIVWLVESGSSPAAASAGASANVAQLQNSGISGTAQFVPTSDGQSTSVTVTLSGTQQDGVYGVTINNGACLGPRLYTLANVVGQANGQGTSTTTVPGQPAAAWFVAVHATSDPTSPLAACGQVQIGSTSGSFLAPVPTATPAAQIPSQNQQPYQLPNGGGGPPKTPIPTPGR